MLRGNTCRQTALFMAHSARDQGREAASRQIEYLSRLNPLRSHSWEATRRPGQIWAVRRSWSRLGRAATRTHCARDCDEGLVSYLSLAIHLFEYSCQPETSEKGSLMNTRQLIVVYWLSRASCRQSSFISSLILIHNPVGITSNLSCCLSHGFCVVAWQLRQNNCQRRHICYQENKSEPQ